MMQSFEKPMKIRLLSIFKAAETVHLILLFFLGDATRCVGSADLKMVARNRPLEQIKSKL